MAKPKFSRVLHEVNVTLNFISTFDTVVSTAIVFCSFFLLYSFFRIEPLMAVYPAGFYLVINLSIRLAADKISIVERAYPNLDQKLKTSRDYMNSSNQFVLALQEEIKADLKTVEAASFFSIPGSVIKIMMVVALCFLILGLMPYSIVMGDMGHVFSDAIRKLPAKVLPIIQQKPAGGGAPETAWYGNYSVAGLSKQDQVNVQMIESNYKLLSTVTNEPIDKKFKENSYAAEFDMSPEELYSKSIVKNDQEIVRNYFNEIAKS